MLLHNTQKRECERYMGSMRSRRLRRFCRCLSKTMTGLTKGKQLRFTIRNVRGLSDSGKRNYTDREIEDQKIFRQELRRFAKKPTEKEP